MAEKKTKKKETKKQNSNASAGHKHHHEYSDNIIVNVCGMTMDAEELGELAKWLKEREKKEAKKTAKKPDA